MSQDAISTALHADSNSGGHAKTGSRSFDQELRAMKTFVHCGHLFTGQEDDARAGETLVFDERGTLDYVGPEKGAPRRARNDQVHDYSAYFVMPGLVDV